DIEVVDVNFPGGLAFTILFVSEALYCLLSVIFVLPVLLLAVIPVLVAFAFLFSYFNRSSVQFRRLASKSWSKLCAYTQDSYTGADSVRVFDSVNRFRDGLCRIIDNNAEAIYVEDIAKTWIQVRVDLISDLVVFAFIVFAVVMGNRQLVTLGVVALVIDSCITFCGYASGIARMWRDVEVEIVSIERVCEYIRNKHEAPWRYPTSRVPPSWPVHGRIVFQDLCLRYRPDDDLVLKSINLAVEGSQRVGVVGRTGAGKTSLTVALFRLVEPASGSILIDDVDIARLGLHELRRAITIIPQDPVLFCGTLRSNLDPFDEYTEDELWAAVRKAHMSDFVEAFEKKLDEEIAEGGSNMSVGQRQLVCLARALLRQGTKILVLDEATAAIDVATDALIQNAIRENFPHSTVLTVAHRLNTIMDYDKILVMEAGAVKEFDSPQALLSNTDSVFYDLAKKAGVLPNQ
ncbi:multidrug resistance-associated protein 1-like protein, partial [Aphelenchoides avenae]